MPKIVNPNTRPLNNGPSLDAMFDALKLRTFARPRTVTFTMTLLPSGREKEIVINIELIKYVLVNEVAASWIVIGWNADFTIKYKIEYRTDIRKGSITPVFQVVQQAD